MGTISISIIAGVVGLISGFILACWLSADIFSEREQQLAALSKENLELKAESSRLRTANTAAKSRMDAMHKEMDGLYRQSTARRV
jgi:hypothetical protein